MEILAEIREALGVESGREVDEARAPLPLATARTIPIALGDMRQHVALRLDRIAEIAREG